MGRDERKEVVALAEGIAKRAVVSFPFLSLETGSRSVAQSGLKPATCPLSRPQSVRMTGTHHLAGPKGAFLLSLGDSSPEPLRLAAS